MGVFRRKGENNFLETQNIGINLEACLKIITNALGKICNGNSKDTRMGMRMNTVWKLTGTAEMGRIGSPKWGRAAAEIRSSEFFGYITFNAKHNFREFFSPCD